MAATDRRFRKSLMSKGASYEFEWDDAKAESNLAKHGVDFMDAMSVLLDPLAMTRFRRRAQ